MSVCLAVYPRMLAWLGMWIGLRLRSSTKAVVWSVALLAAWCLVIPIAEAVWETVGVVSQDSVALALLFSSPLMNAFFVHIGSGPYEWDLWPWVFVNGIWHNVLLMWLRDSCVDNADRYLGRASSPIDQPDAAQHHHTMREE